MTAYVVHKVTKTRTIFEGMKPLEKPYFVAEYEDTTKSDYPIRIGAYDCESEAIEACGDHAKIIVESDVKHAIGYYQD